MSAELLAAILIIGAALALWARRRPPGLARVDSQRFPLEDEVGRLLGRHLQRQHTVVGGFYRAAYDVRLEGSPLILVKVIPTGHPTLLDVDRLALARDELAGRGGRAVLVALDELPRPVRIAARESHIGIIDARGLERLRQRYSTTRVRPVDRKLARPSAADDLFFR